MEYSERECWEETVRQLKAENTRLMAENTALRERLINIYRTRRNGKQR